MTEVRIDGQTYRRRPLEVRGIPVDQAQMVDTVHGSTLAFPGDYIIVGPQGERSVMRAVEFEQQFEPAPASAPAVATPPAPKRAADLLRTVEGLPAITDIHDASADSCYATFEYPLSAADRDALRRVKLQAALVPRVRHRYAVTRIRNRKG